MFSIKTAADFFDKVEDDYRLFQEKIDDSCKAMNCIMSVYHLHEWIWAQHLKTLKPIELEPGFTVTRLADFTAWLDTRCPHFSLIQELTNGSKHCAPAAETSRISGYGMGPYGIGPWGVPYLLIDLGEQKATLDDRWVVVHAMLAETMDFWRGFCSAQGISGDTP